MTKLFQYQEEAVAEIERFSGRALLSLEMGLGKAQPLDAKVLTPSGWVMMQDIATGDEVIGADGNAIKVVGIFPQGIKRVFRVRFTDGSWTECCADHLWAVNTPLRNWRRMPYIVKSLGEISKKLSLENGNRIHFIPIVKEVNFPGLPVPLDPYLFGYLLVNGCFLNTSASVTIPDNETVERLSKVLPNGLSLKKNGIDYRITKITGTRKRGINPVLANLRVLGLAGKKSHQKFIPQCYLINSIPIRKALLQGLMDGDGWVSKDSYVEYNSSSKKLILHVRSLIQSLGGTARIHCDQKPKYTYNGEVRIGRPSYGLTVALPNGVAPFRLSRKAQRYLPREKYKPARAIESIKPVSYKPCQCIKIDSPDGLYLTKDYIVTHNTLISLEWLHRHPEVRQAIVICPASLKWHWAREAKVHFGMRSEVLSGRTVPESRMTRPCRLVIVNYDILRDWLEFLRGLRPTLVVFDECHCIADRRTQRTRATASLCRGVPHVLALSGTPLLSKPIELWPTLNIIRPTLFPSFWAYGTAHCGARRAPWGWTFNGAARLPELHGKLLDSLMIRRLKRDVLSQLPDKARHVVPLGIDGMPQYREAERDFLGWLAKQSKSRAKRAARAQAMVKLGYLKRLAGILKVERVKEWVDGFLAESDDKIILFGIHNRVLNALVEHYKGRCVLVNGSVTGQRRQQAFDRFLGDRRTRVFVGNIDAAGVGWSAKGVSNIAFVEHAWTPGKHVQAEDRCHGLGRGVEGHKSISHWLVAKGTIEESLVRLIQRKARTLDAVMDGRSTSGLNVFDELCRVMRRRLA